MGEQAPEGLYEKLVQNAGDVIAVLDERGTIAFVNNRVAHYPGFTAIETMGRHYTEFVHPDDFDRFEQEMESVFAGDAVVDFHFRVVMPDGSCTHWLANGTAQELDGKRLVMAICRDVTESMRIKFALIERNKALAALGQIAVALSSCADLAEGLLEALNQITAALGVRVGAIVLKEAGDKVRIGAATVPRLAELSAEAVATRKLISVQAMDTGERIVIPDTSDEGVDPLIRQLAEAVGARAFIAIPLLSKTNTKAALALGADPPGLLSDEQNEFLQLAAGILGPAIENAALHSDLTDRVGRLAMLERLAKTTNSGRDVQTVLESSMREIANLVPYDMGAVVLFRPGVQAEVFPFGKGGTPQDVTALNLSHVQTVLISHLSGPTKVPHESFGHYHNHPGTFHAEGGDAGVVPLVHMGEKVGLLKVWSQEDDQYGEREMEILAAAAEHLAIAVSNAAMYETEQQRSLELAALASEVRHRIKNNLQMVAGLLEMSRNDRDSGIRTVERCLRQVRAISTIHDLLSLDDMSAKMSVKDVLAAVAGNAVQATGRGDEIELSIVGDDCIVGSEAATGIGVMVNELVTNAVEHGFRGMDQGRIEIRVGHSDLWCLVEVTDDGAGLPEDFVLPAKANTASGLGLVSSLAAYGLGGNLEMERGERGVCARVRVKGVRSGIAGIGS